MAIALPPVIKWSGSKRSQADEILSRFPKITGRYFEPFLGGGSILGNLQPRTAICGDICEPLVALWNLIKNDPELLAREYRARWERLQRKGVKTYYEVRDDFNEGHSPHDLLFLSRTCVNGLIRFNKNGNFNNSFHLSRKGIDPSRLEKILLRWSEIVRNHTFHCGDYRSSTRSAKKGDFIYLDPPYFHTRGRYFGTIDFEKFLDYLTDLKKRQIAFALSFDGTRGDTSYSVELPKTLYKQHLMISSGNSTFNKVQKSRVEAVHESLYLSY